MPDADQPQHMEPDGVEAVITPPAPGQPRWRRPILWMALEVVLISASVFLGLLGQQWYETAQRRDEAKASLERFRAEVTINRDEVAKKLTYHEEMFKAIRAYVRADAATRQTIAIGFEHGISPPFFERTAWELAVATQSLTYMDADLAFWLSRTYTFQGLIEDLTRAFTSGMYINPPSTTSEAFLRAADVYYGDLVGMEPNLVKMYDQVLPMIDDALAK